MSILITGAGGFTGSYLAEALREKGKDVSCLVFAGNKNSFLDPSRFRVIRGDITDRTFVKKTVRGYEEIYHLASAMNYSHPSTAHFIKVNVEGTRNIMDAALDAGVRKVVMTSSRVTINEEGSGRVDEEYIHQDFFDNAYALSKFRAEKLAFEYGARGIEVVTLHPTLIYGPREMHTTGPLIRNYLQKRVRFVGFLDSRFNLVYVRDVVGALIGAMKRGRPGHRYIIGGEEVKIGDFLSLLDELTGTRKPVVALPGSVIEAFVTYVAPALKKMGMDIPIAKEQIYAMRSDTLVDISKARKEIGLTVTPLREGLAETLAVYKQNGYI